MRQSREEAARTHARIVEKAAVLFRERGIDGIGLADLMHEAGLTHGGFYKHFESKDGLAAEACAHGLAESARRMRRRAEKNPADPLAAVIEGFLSAEHVEDAGRGCTVAALGSDMFRCAEPTREAFTKGVAELIAIMAEVQPEKSRGGAARGGDDEFRRHAGGRGAGPGRQRSEASSRADRFHAPPALARFAGKGPEGKAPWRLGPESPGGGRITPGSCWR